MYIYCFIYRTCFIYKKPSNSRSAAREGRHFAVLTQAHGGLNFLPFHFCNYEKSVTVPVRGCQKAT